MLEVRLEKQVSWSLFWGGPLSNMAGITSLSSRRTSFNVVDSRHSSGLRSHDSTVIWVILHSPLSGFGIDSLGQVAISSMKTSLGFWKVESFRAKRGASRVCQAPARQPTACHTDKSKKGGSVAAPAEAWLGKTTKKFRHVVSQEVWWFLCWIMRPCV